MDALPEGVTVEIRAYITNGKKVVQSYSFSTAGQKFSPTKEGLESLVSGLIADEMPGFRAMTVDEIFEYRCKGFK